MNTGSVAQAYVYMMVKNKGTNHCRTNVNANFRAQGLHTKVGTYPRRGRRVYAHDGAGGDDAEHECVRKITHISIYDLVVLRF